MIRLFLTLALLLALPAQATINAASFQRTASLCADGTRNARYPAGGASCTPFPPSPSPDYVRLWADGLSNSSTAETIHNTSDIDVALRPASISGGNGFDTTLVPWARTVIEAGTLESGRAMHRVENRSDYLDNGGTGRRRYEIQVAEGTGVQYAEIGVPQCWGYPVRFNKGPYGDGKSWRVVTGSYQWVISGQNSPAADGAGPSFDMYVSDSDASDKIGIQMWLNEGLSESGSNNTTHSYYYDPDNPGATVKTRKASLDKVYWIVFGLVNDPLNTGVGRARLWVIDPLLWDSATKAGSTLVGDYAGRVGFADYPEHMRKKTGLYITSRAGASYQADFGTISGYEIVTADPSANAAALDACRDVVVASFGAVP